MNDKTSDYWQRDEAKFQKFFNSGAGAVFIDEVEFDDCTQTYSVQASLPVKSAGKVIGALTITWIIFFRPIEICNSFSSQRGR